MTFLRIFFTDGSDLPVQLVLYWMPRLMNSTSLPYGTLRLVHGSSLRFIAYLYHVFYFNKCIILQTVGVWLIDNLSVKEMLTFFFTYS